MLDINIGLFWLLSLSIPMSSESENLGFVIQFVWQTMTYEFLYVIFIIVFSRYKVGFIECAIFSVCISYLILFLWIFFDDSHFLFISKPLCNCFLHLFILHYCFPFLLFSIVSSLSIFFCYKNCLMISFMISS